MCRRYEFPIDDEIGRFRNSHERESYKLIARKGGGDLIQRTPIFDPKEVEIYEFRPTHTTVCGH